VADGRGGKRGAVEVLVSTGRAVRRIGKSSQRTFSKRGHAISPGVSERPKRIRKESEKSRSRNSTIAASSAKKGEGKEKQQVAITTLNRKA